MVAMTAPGSVRQLRPARDPVRPLGAWLPVLLVGSGIMLSLLGWATASRLELAQESAVRTSTSAVVSQREALLADRQLVHVQDQRDGLRAIVVHRCDTEQIRDVQLCDAARAIVPAR